MSVDNENGAKPGVKDLLHTIRKSPALMVSVLVGGALIVYLLIKRGPSSGTSTTPVDGTSLAASTTPGGYYQSSDPDTQPIYLTIIPPVITPAPSGSPVPTPTPTPTPTPAPPPPAKKPPPPPPVKKPPDDEDRDRDRGGGGATIPSSPHPVTHLAKATIPSTDPMHR